MMSGTMIIAILLSIAPLFLPVVMQVMEMLTGLIQAYIFSILAMVYIAAATQMEEDKLKQEQTGDRENG
jgi:F-type H+-transporting ATPase subunit a